MTNNAITGFVSEFENRFSNVMIDPASFKRYKNKLSFPNSKYFKFWYDKQPTDNLSDWDLACWLDVTSITGTELEQIDNFIRAYKDFSHIGLFTTDYDQVKHLQYMAYTPNQPFAPFLDLHLRGEFSDNLFSTIYSGVPEEHKMWVILTVWRKIKKGETDRAKQTFIEQRRNYWSEKDWDKMVNSPDQYYAELFPKLEAPSSLMKG